MKTSKLEKLNACSKAIKYVKTQKSAKSAWKNCERGDWMLWLAKKLNVNDRKLTLAKARCADQVRHLMKDQRSIDTLDACYKYARGEISRKELNVYSDNAYAAYTASSATTAATYAAYAAFAAAYTAVDTAYDSVRILSLKKPAEICREILTEDVLRKYKM